MKQILAAILSALLFVQPVFAMPVREPVLYADVQGEAEDNDDTQKNANTQEPAEGAGCRRAGNEAGPQVSAPSAILMEASTGQIIYEKDADEQRPPASVTKIMTLLLIFDALDSGKISLEDEVSTSEYAASMGGSQVFLEPGETQTVDTMIKCIAVASANDACVAMAEYICGNEEEFVKQMNQRAKGLGMENTHFINCNGLDTDGHLTTAHDIALMSRELITTYPQIHDYSMIWMENITHTTKKGTTEFGLTNTNKLVRQYEYATGLKTGSTDKAKYCVSATAKKDGMELIAVIMAAPDHKQRFTDATTLLNYGFGKCNKYEEEKAKSIQPAKVSRGVAETVKVRQKAPFAYIDITGADLKTIERKVALNKKIKAPVKKGDKVGKAKYFLSGKEIGSIDIVAAESVDEISYKSAMGDTVKKFLL
ncbi:MAG: D-alanyl-D-alanine carboxypeptidase family protein [[Clostridium] scindens]